MATFMLSAGEASGDLHAAALIRELRRLDPEAKFAFLGGDLMAAEAKRPPIVHYRDMAYMGFADVVRHLPQVGRNLRLARLTVEKVRPDALILVDYPSFNLRLAAEARKQGVPVFYFISPKVWAWKEYRTARIAELCTRVLSILPFEPEFYARHAYERCSYVGNPSVEEIDSQLAALTPAALEELRREVSPRGKPIVVLVPGSRRGEIERNLPGMLEAIGAVADKYCPVIAGAPSVPREAYPEGVHVVFGKTVELMHAAQAALVTSGTASLEAALVGVPQVVCYRHTGSRLLHALMSRVLKIPFVSLPNLIAGHKVVDELLLHHCTPAAILRSLLAILPGQPGRQAQLDGYAAVRAALSDAPAAANAAALILADLRG